jgi:hypothetical protein
MIGMILVTVEKVKTAAIVRLMRMIMRKMVMMMMIMKIVMITTLIIRIIIRAIEGPLSLAER